MREPKYLTGGETLFLHHLHTDRIFQEMDRQDYIFLFAIRRGIESSELEDAVYLSDLADQLGITIANMSRMATKLQDKGYITWKTDLEKERTYISLTGKAKEVLQAQRKLLEEGHRKIHEQIDEEQLKVTLQTMGQIAEIIKEVIGE